MANVEIKELKIGGAKFFPQTHIEGVVGNEGLAYLGETKAHTADDGSQYSSASSKRSSLSVSERKGVIVGRAIPLHPRMGKRYYFGDGFIKVKSDYADEERRLRNIDIYCLDKAGNPDYKETIKSSSSWNGKGALDPVIVTIIKECKDEEFDIAKHASVRTAAKLTCHTESPFIEIIDGKVVVTDTPRPKSYNNITFAKTSTIKFAIRIRHKKSNSYVTYRRIWENKPRYPMLNTGRANRNHISSFRGDIHVHRLRRGRMGKSYYRVWGRHNRNDICSFIEYRA